MTNYHAAALLEPLFWILNVFSAHWLLNLFVLMLLFLFHAVQQRGVSICYWYVCIISLSNTRSQSLGLLHQHPPGNPPTTHVSTFILFISIWLTINPDPMHRSIRHRRTLSSQICLFFPETFAHTIMMYIYSPLIFCCRHISKFCKISICMEPFFFFFIFLFFLSFITSFIINTIKFELLFSVSNF